MGDLSSFRSILSVRMRSCPPFGMASRVHDEIQDHLFDPARVGADDTGLRGQLSFQVDVFPDATRHGVMTCMGVV